MRGLAWLALIRESNGLNAKFVIRSYEDTIKIGTYISSSSGADVKVVCIKVREFEPDVREKMTKNELDHYKVEETTPGQNWVLDVIGKIDGFNEGEDIYIK